MSRKKIESYSQCVFVQEREDDARVETTGYIDAKQARVGARMTLRDLEGTWTVERAGRPGPRPRHTSWGEMD